MRRTASGWLHRSGLTAVAAVAVFGWGTVAVSEEQAAGQTGDPPAASQSVGESGVLEATFSSGTDVSTVSAAEATRPPSTIPEPPTLAPRRKPARPVPVGPAAPLNVQVPAAGAAPSAAGDSLQVKVRSDSPEKPGEAVAASQETAGTTEQEPLEPIPDSHGSTSVDVETASFNGVTPGVTTLAQLQENWGTSVKIAKREGTLIYLYAIEPFDKVEVSVSEDKVRSIVIRLDRTFPAATVAEQLELAEIRPVFISTPLGEIIGQAFPERGVLFGFAPGEDPAKPSMQVAQIVLEPVTAEPFVLRAETYFDKELALTVADLEQAIKLDPKDARAQWLYARALSALDKEADALRAAAESVRLAPTDAQYRATHAQLLGQAEHFDEAIREAEEALATSRERPHIEARTLCLLGDLFGSGPHPDYKQAMDYHMKAIRAAEPLAKDPHPAIQVTAKEVLLDAHLGAAHDIAWGTWNQKEVAVSRWLQRASEIAENLTDDEARSAEYRFRVAQRAMAAHVGLKGSLDPTPWTEQTLRSADRAIAAAHDTLKKRQILWELGTTLYDATQIYQMRGEQDVALKCGQQAVQCFEQVARDDDRSAVDSYLLGRLYFRLGAIYAIGKQDHRQAIAWFDKALGIFDRTAGQIGGDEFGRLGETLVSMGVSYWEVGDREKATEVTQRGVKLVEKAVDAGSVDKSALEIPYGNLAAMRRALDTPGLSEPAVQNARRPKDTSLK